MLFFLLFGRCCCSCFKSSLSQFIVYFCVHVFVGAVVWCWCTVFFFFRQRSFLIFYLKKKKKKCSQSDEADVSTKMFMFMHCMIMNNTVMNNASESSWIVNNAAVPVRVCSTSTCIISGHVYQLRTTLVYLLKLLYIWQRLSVTNIILSSNNNHNNNEDNNNR